MNLYTVKTHVESWISQWEGAGKNLTDAEKECLADLKALDLNTVAKAQVETIAKVLNGKSKFGFTVDWPMCHECCKYPDVLIEFDTVYICYSCIVKAAKQFAMNENVCFV